MLGGIAIFLLALALRLPFVNGLPDTPDAIHLESSRQEFDVLALSPHFPGYPVAVWLARRMPGSDGQAWGCLGAWAGAATALLAGLWIASRQGQVAGLMAGLGVAVFPLTCLESVRIATDTLCLPFLLAALLLLEKRQDLAAGFLLGLALGVRPSAFPWMAALIASQRPWRALLGLLCAVTIWLVPTLALEGVTPYLAEGWRFLSGHLQGWGNTVWEGQGEWFPALAEHWLRAPFQVPDLAPPLRLLLAATLIFGALRARRVRDSGRRDAALLGAAAYAVWLILAQNTHHVRHVLPLVTLFVALAFAGLFPRAQGGPWLVRHAARSATLLMLGLLPFLTLRQMREYSRSRPPSFEVAEALARRPEFDAALDVIYAAADQPYFRRILPEATVRTARDLQSLRRDLAGLPVSPRELWVSSLVLEPTPARDPTIRRERALALGDWQPVAAIYRLAPEEFE